jgi:hypothetical protein
MNKLGAFLVVILGMFTLSSCASIVAGGPSVLTANSKPLGATVTAKGMSNGEALTGKTPTTFTLDKGSDYTLTFALGGYQSEEIIVRRTVNGWFFGNFLLGIVPMIVDAATNNMWQHTLSVANVDFTTQTANSDGSISANIIVATYDAEGKQQFTRVPITFYKL